MNVRVKGVDVEMEIKNHGVELEVQDAGGTFLGNVILTKTQVIWCRGYTSREHGKKLDWEAFARLMDAKGSR